MKTTRTPITDTKPFATRTREIRARLRFGPATLRCEVQTGYTPHGRYYSTPPQWWIKHDGTPCFAGPWTADAIRHHHAPLPQVGDRVRLNHSDAVATVAAVLGNDPPRYALQFGADDDCPASPYYHHELRIILPRSRATAPRGWDKITG